MKGNGREKMEIKMWEKDVVGVEDGMAKDNDVMGLREEQEEDGSVDAELSELCMVEEAGKSVMIVKLHRTVSFD